MSRRMMTREITKTVVKVAKISIVEGLPQVQELEDETLVGNVKLARAQKLLNDKHGEPVTIISLEPETLTYELPVSEFIKVASIKEDKQEDDEEVPENAPE